MITVYKLDVPVRGKMVQFAMKADESLKPVRKVDEITTDKWRRRLETVANIMFKENDNAE